MSYYDYEQGIRIACRTDNFEALIQAAMRHADTDNLEKLKNAFPEVWKELQERYNLPNGMYPGEFQGG